MQYFGLEEKSNNYTKLLQIPSRIYWLLSLYFSVFIILVINTIIAFLFLSIFLQKNFILLDFFYNLFFSLLFNAIYIPIFTILAIKFGSSISIAFSFITMVFSIYYGTTSLGKNFRDFIPLLYSFAVMNNIYNNNVKKIILLILIYLIFLIIIIYFSKKWYEKLDG